MNVSAFIARRIIFNAQPSFSRFIIRLAVAATVLSIATMVVTLSLVNGFQQAVAAKVYSFWGQARVQPLDAMRMTATDGPGFLRSTEVEQAIARQKNVQHYHGYAVKSVVLRKGGSFEGLMLKGVDHLYDSSQFHRFMQQGQALRVADSSHFSDVLISSRTAERLELQVGDTLQCFFIRSGQDVRSRPMLVRGIYRTGIDEYDKNFALADVRFLQRLNQWPAGQIGGYEMWLQHPAQANTVADSLDAVLPVELAAFTIQQIFPNIFDWLSIQDQTKQIVIITMLVVAIINLITCLLILVMERTRMVGVLQALGMGSKQVGHIFWLYAGWIALLGTGGGLLLGLGLCWLQQATGIISMDEETYYVATAPVAINAWEVAAVVAAGFVVILVAVRLPLLYVQRISPLKAIRFA